MYRRDYKAIFNAVSKIPQVDKLISIGTMHLVQEDVIIALEVKLNRWFEYRYDQMYNR